MKKNILFMLVTGTFIFCLVYLAEATPIITNGLVAAYEFNGNANDLVGSNHGTVSGASLTADRYGNPNSAYFFDGINDYIAINPVFNSEQVNLTYSAWVNMYIERGSIYVECESWGSTRNYFHIGDEFVFDQYPSSIPGNATVDADLSDHRNEWMNFSLVKDGNKIHGYLDGVFLGTANYIERYTGSPSTIAAIGNRIIGGTWDHHLYNYAFYGIIDDLYIYNRALTAAEIQQIASPVPEPGTIFLIGIGMAALVGIRIRRKML